MGRPVLSRRHSGRRGDGQCRPQWWAGARTRLLCELPRGISGPSNPARGRRLLDRFLLLPVGLALSTTTAWLWLAVVASGLYHGVNPGMGWPLAVSAGLMEKSPRAVFLALWPLSAGHVLAILLMLLP